jgi:rhodanese-related sulfurtransferase
MPGPDEISVSQLARLIGTADQPQIIDVRPPEDRDADPFLMPTATVAHYLTPETALTSGKPIAVTCFKGGKFAQGAAALLRNMGHRAEVIEGGWHAWRAAGLPVIERQARDQSLWVTRHRPKVDRIACPWLIRRFVNPQARFLFVSPQAVPEVAAKFGAIPFDIDGVPHSHDGELCTFDTLLTLFGLQSEALSRMALVIRAADTDRHDLAPQAAGLLALSVGLSRQFKDDLAQLEAGMVLYDALYRWARDGFDEGHDWPANRPRQEA